MDRAVSADPHGYRCKHCGQPAPLGVGYAVAGRAAYASSVGVLRCPCGHSVHPDLVK
jgi:hypothetical protein